MCLFTPDWHTALRPVLKQAPEALNTEVSVLSAGSWGCHTPVLVLVPGPCHALRSPGLASPAQERRSEMGLAFRPLCPWTELAPVTGCPLARWERLSTPVPAAVVCGLGLGSAAGPPCVFARDSKNSWSWFLGGPQGPQGPHFENP